MKQKIVTIIVFLGLIFAFGCEDYLDKAPESDLTIEEVFKDFDHAQGFVEEMYAMMVDYGNGGFWQTDYLFGDDGIINNDWMPSTNIDKGNLNFWKDSPFSIFGSVNQEGTPDPDNELPFRRLGIWEGSLKGIRKANIALDHIDLMVNATQDEKDIIMAQCYFFRAYFHMEIMKFWGRFPYIDHVLDNDFKIPRPETFKETALKIDEDFDRAIALLPVNWDDMPYGSKTAGKNKGRINKGAAYALKGKNLLFAASPLMIGSTDTYEYDKELCEMATVAFAEVFKLSDQGVYALMPWDRIEEVFWKVSNSTAWPGGTEWVFNGTSFVSWYARWLATISMDGKVNGETNTLSPTHNFIYNNFGMANGLSIEDDLSGKYGKPMYDPAKPFENRDPRFYKWITIDGDKLVDKTLTGPDSVHMTAKLYTGGEHRSLTGSSTGYFYKKFHPTYASTWSYGLYESSKPMLIKVRLTDVYLMYAEALLAAKGSATVASSSYNLSAEQVINLIRDRAGVPHVNSAIVADANKFMDELRRDRSVELCYEAHRWVDLRRWVLAHLPKYKTKTGLDFPKDHSYFKEFVLVNRVCDYPKHYWMPFETKQTQLYEGFPQNPGW